MQTNDVLAVLNFSRLANNSMVICSHFEYVLENYSSNVVEVDNTLIQKVCKARIKMHASDELFAALCSGSLKSKGIDRLKNDTYS